MLALLLSHPVVTKFAPGRYEFCTRALLLIPPTVTDYSPYGIKYSDAYEVYGLTRTGCCGCPISYKAVDDLEKIRMYEPNVVKAAWNIFGKSYEYRMKYNEYKKQRMAAEKAVKAAEENIEGQMSFNDFPEVMP